MLGEIASWWTQQMSDLLPQALVRRDASGDSAVVVRCPADPRDGFEVVQRRGRRETAIGRYPLDEKGLDAARRAMANRPRSRTTILLVPPGALLERQVPLPLAAEREAGRVLGYEMDRLTPFTADEIFWTWSLAGRDRARGRIMLRLSLVPKAAVATMLAHLQRIGIAPTRLEAPAPDGEARAIPLDDGTGRSAWGGRTVAAGGVVCAALALALIVAPFILQSIRLDAIDERIETLRPRVTIVERLRQKIAGNAAGSDVVAAERAHTGDALQVLATVTDLLPDDTWLTDLTLNQGKLGLAGQSAAAAKLIPVLAAEPLLRNPAFIAPVTRAEGGTADIFSIRAELSQ